MVLNRQTDWGVIFDLFHKKNLSVDELLMGPDFFEIARECYNRNFQNINFSDFLWTLRSIYLPMFWTLRMDVPKADLYHCVATGYAGILGSMAKHFHGSSLLISEHGIYTREREEELIAGEQEFLRRYDVDDFTKPLLKRIYAFVLLFKELTEEYNLDVISSECWTSMEKITGVLPCSAYGFLLDQGYLVSCESDLHASITMALLSCASFGKEVPCFGEFTVRHPSDENVELLWHCGPFPYSLHREDKKPIIYVQRQWFEAREGTYTVARFDQEDGKYMILNGTCESAEGPFTNGNYIWGRFNDLDRWERRLVEGPYIHHVVEIRGDYTREIQEFCKYFPNVVPDSMN